MRGAVSLVVWLGACAPHVGEGDDLAGMVDQAPQDWSRALVPDEVERDESPPLEPAEAVEVPDDARIELGRGLCLGSCPVYTVTLHADGNAEWHGEMHVATVGEASRRISRREFRRLWHEIHQHPLHYLQGRGSKCRAWADAPSTLVTVTGGGRAVRIELDFLCTVDSTLWRRFARIPERIDQVGGTKAWIGDGLDRRRLRARVTESGPSEVR